MQRELGESLPRHQYLIHCHSSSRSQRITPPHWETGHLCLSSEEQVGGVLGTGRGDGNSVVVKVPKLAFLFLWELGTEPAVTPSTCLMYSLSALAIACAALALASIIVIAVLFFLTAVSAIQAKMASFLSSAALRLASLLPPVLPFSSPSPVF